MADEKLNRPMIERGRLLPCAGELEMRPVRAKRDSACLWCGAQIEVGEECWYSLTKRRVLCGGCGEQVQP